MIRCIFTFKIRLKAYYPKTNRICVIYCILFQLVFYLFVILKFHSKPIIRAHIIIWQTFKWSLWLKLNILLFVFDFITFFCHMIVLFHLFIKIFNRKHASSFNTYLFVISWCAIEGSIASTFHFHSWLCHEGSYCYNNLPFSPSVDDVLMYDTICADEL